MNKKQQIKDNDLEYIKNLKCCGNCKNSWWCEKTNYLDDGYCEEWVFDGIINERRIELTKEYFKEKIENHKKGEINGS